MKNYLFELPEASVVLDGVSGDACNAFSAATDAVEKTFFLFIGHIFGPSYIPGSSIQPQIQAKSLQMAQFVSGLIVKL